MSHSCRFLFLTLFLGALRHSAPAQEARPAIPPTLATRQTPFAIALPHPSDSSVEHWDKLPLRDNDLHADPPISGQIDTFPWFTRELLRVQWRGGDPIDLYVIRPAGVAKPPVILYLYGYPAESDRYLNTIFCKTVTKD